MKVRSWGNNPKIRDGKIIETINFKDEIPICFRGNGRSYGDASLYPKMLNCLNNKTQLTIENGILNVSAGFLLYEVINFCHSNHFLFPIIPGTAHVSIGGMIASDVHGKNHKVNGTIGNWIKSIKLQLGEKEFICCSLEENSELFNATIGGMGLTGMIHSVEIYLEKAQGNELVQNTISFNNLLSVLNALEISSADYQTVWVDLLNKENYILIENTWKSGNKTLTFIPSKARISIPNLPFSFLSKSFMKVYNFFYLRKQKSHKIVTPIEAFFPLDLIDNWNKLYGPKGFFQYQFVIPKSVAFSGIEKIINKIKKSNFPVYLAVIKIHGSKPSPGMLSFPIEGYSVALDFPNRKGLNQFLNELDELVIGFSGRVYLAKDATLQSQNFEKMYPNSKEFKVIINKYFKGKYTSLLAERLNLTK